MAQSITDIMTSLAPQYDPQKAIVNNELAALPGQQAADQAGLDTAKTNAFNDVTNAAGARGVLYSGAPINEENRYVGEKYLPAQAALKSNYLDKTSTFQRQLLDIGSAQATDARNIQTNQQAAEEKAANDAAQLQLQRETAANNLALKQSTAASAKPSAADQATAIRASLNQDLAGAFSNYKTRPSYYTENVVIPKLIAAYPELDQKQLISTIYSYRKGLGLG